jgi:hypothetical protein
VDDAGARSVGALPELAAVHWRPRASEVSLARTGRLWTLTTVAHTVPFIATAALLVALDPITAQVAMIAFGFAWSIPELCAARGAQVIRRWIVGAGEPERRAFGLLGDLVDHRAREWLARTGLAIERGALGAWVVGEAGAILVRPGGRRVHCYCVRTTDPELPSSDRIAHLLLALRSDETGFVTIANLAFSGARWRLARRLDPPARLALSAAVAAARAP